MEEQRVEISPTEKASRQKDFESRVSEARVKIMAVVKEYQVDIRGILVGLPNQSGLITNLQYFDTKQWDRPTPIPGSDTVEIATETNEKKPKSKKKK